uniref:G-protein coupled receptors family 1 profile domain-containing protein n=1 Tax=Scleropages formosus TaxID=113540 RepID=A0A8C9WA11_SCLFO
GPTAFNTRNISHTDFILSGFSGSSEWKQLLFIPFFLLFVMSVTANSMIIFIILSHRALHSPMYLLICVMAFVDLVIPIFFVPNMLFNLLFNWNHISLMGCLVQMFCIHFFQTVQTTILLWMALDRFYAICTPLHYNEHMRFSAFLKFVIILLLRNAVFISAIVGLARSLSYCQSNEIKHCFCEHMALVTLACGPIYVNSVVGLCAAFFTLAADVLFIVFSYVRIFVSLFKSGRPSQKALSTCITHIIVMFVGLIFALTSFLSYRIKNDMSSNSHMTISTMYLLLPACLNPIIYGIRTKEIRQQVIKVMKCGKKSP